MLKALFLYFQIIAVFALCSQSKTNVPAVTAQNPSKIVIRKILFSELQNINDVYYFKEKPFTGTSIELFDDKTRMQEIQWKNGLIDGTKTEYFKGGKLVRAELNFKNGHRNGYFRYFHQNGKLKLNGKYVDDLLDSVVNAFYENGNPKYAFTYEMGVKTGLSVLYYNNGNIEQRVNLVNELPQGRMETYYEAGNLRLVTNYNQGIRDGQLVRYHLNGTMAEESYFKDGVQDSVSYYWDNVFGSIMKIENYKLGSKDGIWVTFNEIGDTLTMYTYQENILHGPYRIYISEKLDNPSQSGNIKSYSSEYIHALDEYGAYEHGRQDGVFKTGLYLRENHVEGHFKNGIKIGEWRYYDENDKQVLFELYSENGELLKQKPKQRRISEE